MAGPWTDDAFKGALTLWYRPEPVVTFELRWKAGSNSGRITFPGAQRIVARLADEAADIELASLARRVGEEELDRLCDAEDPAIAHIDDYIPLIHQHASGLLKSFAGPLRSAGDYGTWGLTQRASDIFVVWREASQRRERRIPLGALLWGHEHVGALLERTRVTEAAAADNRLTE